MQFNLPNSIVDILFPLSPNLEIYSLQELRAIAARYKQRFVVTFTVNKKKEKFRDKHGPLYNKELFMILRHQIDTLTKRLKGSYILYQEIGKGNNPHYHGLLFFNNLTEDQFYNMDTYCQRNIGILDMRKIHSLTEEYDEYIPQRARRNPKVDTRKTDFETIVKYIQKEKQQIKRLIN